MSVEEIRAVVKIWSEQYIELGARDDVDYVQIFENRGAMMGASNPHANGQIWACRSLPNEVVAECGGQQAYWAEKNEVLLCAYLAMEEELGERLVEGNASFVALVPYWAVWPFEVMILPRRHMTRFQEMTDTQRLDFAAILQAVRRPTISLRHAILLFDGAASRAVRWKSTPGVAVSCPLYPPLLRSATIRKFKVGFELLGGPQRDITPESQQRRCGRPGRGSPPRGPHCHETGSRLSADLKSITCTSTINQHGIGNAVYSKI
jgi:UDPglucose--hexose-1-phosphate uridylyltransferase